MWWLVAVVGSVTAFVGLRAETIAGAALTAVVAGLLIVQAPMDVRTRHLSRRATMVAVALVSLVIAVDVIGDGVGQSGGVAFGVAAVVVAVYALLHRLSPRSLGWGKSATSVRCRNCSRCCSGSPAVPGWGVNTLSLGI